MWAYRLQVALMKSSEQSLLFDYHHVVLLQPDVTDLICIDVE